jgi:ribose/xylose/arabinose/galactoside ABC-type transport system permease subunit
MGFNLMLNLAIPIILATMAQLFVIAGNDLDLSIGSFIGFVCCVAATWLTTDPLLGASILLGSIIVYALLGALIHWRNLPSIVVTLGMSFVWQGLAVLVLPDPGGAAGLFGGRDLLAHAVPGEEGFLEAHAASDIQTAEPEVAHQVGGVDVLGNIAVVLEGVAGGGGDAFIPLAWVVAQVAGEQGVVE